jgi:hypothetical protein
MKYRKILKPGIKTIKSALQSKKAISQIQEAKIEKISVNVNLSYG